MIPEAVLQKLEFQRILQFIAKHSITERGKNNILSTLPELSCEASMHRGKLVSQAKDILIKGDFPPMEFLPELTEVLASSRIEGSLLDEKKILDILKLAIISRQTFYYLKNQKDDAPDLSELAGELFADKILEQHISNVIDEKGEVKETASVKLAEIRRDIRRKKDELIKTVNKLMKSLTESAIVREDYLTLRDGRVVIPIKVEHKRHLRGFIHSESATGQTVYIEPEQTLELNNEIVSLSFAERREIERLLRELTKKIGSVSFELTNSLNTIGVIDEIFSAAKYSIEIIGDFPFIDDSKPFNILDAKHPILLKKFGREGTVPLNSLIEEKKIILITGPNAGGKTVVLKTIGLLSLMIKCGFHIPANHDSNFRIFDKIFLDIGDEQSIEDDLSTFSSHLSNINKILDESDEDTLVLLDEIGTGTDPAEGSALAAAVLLSLRDKKATVFATTHHGNLKLIANKEAGFENAAMEFDYEYLKPTYKFKQGVPGSSYAFEIAKRIGFEEAILESAKNHLETDKHELEKFLVEIEYKSKLAEDKFRKAEIENTRLAGLTNLYRNKLAKLETEKKEILRKTKLEAGLYLEGVNKKVENIIKELKETNARKDIIKDSHKVIDQLKDEHKNLFANEVDLKEEIPNFAAGDFASIKETNTVGEIEAIIEDKQKAVLKVGMLHITVPLNGLMPSKKNKEKVEAADGYRQTLVSYPQIRIDIRGERPDAAEFEVIKFLDNAYTAGIERVEILHGKGTGALKKTVKDILKSHNKVKIFYFAPIELGGDGITIAELK